MVQQKQPSAWRRTQGVSVPHVADRGNSLETHSPRLTGITKCNDRMHLAKIRSEDYMTAPVSSDSALRLLVSRWPIDRWQRNILQSKIHAQLRTVMNRVTQNECTQTLGARNFEYLLAAHL